MTLALHHLALRTRDVEQLTKFYRDVLGLTERKRQENTDGTVRSIWLEAGTVVLMIEHAAPNEPAPAAGSHDLVAFAIDASELGAWRARLAHAGVGIEAEAAFTLYVRDPDGRRVGVSGYRFR